MAIWIELTAEGQDDIAQVKTALEKALMPMNFVSLDDFYRRKLQPGEAITLYANGLRKLLTHATPDIAAAEIPEPISRQLRTSGEIKTLDRAIERARLRLLMTIEPEPLATRILVCLWESRMKYRC